MSQPLFRPPVVAILGHVDHGKTTLLDYIRKTKLTSKEHGGITQRIGAYEVETGIKGYHTGKITFIDTPGHEAFTKLRLRGAEVADIALLLIDAKDSVMPQTVESIAHINAAKTPCIVVINKIDLPEAKPEKVKADLMKHDVVVEEKGGKTPSVAISAKTGKGVPELLESILLLASELNLSYSPKSTPKAYIIETKKDKRGIAATVVIKDGTLNVGDAIFAEGKKAKIRAMINDLGKPISSAVPSLPFEFLGFDELPEVGALISSTPGEETEKKPPSQRKTPFDMQAFLKGEEEKKLSLIVKAESQGSLEAVTSSLTKQENVEIVSSGVGDINTSDVFLAKTARAIIIGFNTIPTTEAKDIAKQEKVVIKTYNIIYELLKELVEVSQLLKEREEKEKNVKGEAKILATFVIHDQKIYGIRVTKGKINLNDNMDVYRDSSLVGKTKLMSLQTKAKKIDEVKKDQEAGMVFAPLLDIRVGDMIKSVL
ncbi:translation initiation factor IF-2 [Candidatus Roizmanbacteria bacterium]|nr:translation initiation factor IF-2 [Candidatus Roizmanbacteria bacterium]